MGKIGGNKDTDMTVNSMARVVGVNFIRLVGKIGGKEVTFWLIHELPIISFTLQLLRELGWNLIH